MPFLETTAKEKSFHTLFKKATMDFKEVSKMDAINSMEQELDKLLSTGSHLSHEKKDMYARELQDFKHLFTNFVSMKSSTIDWNKIEKLSSDSIKLHNTLQSPSSVAETKSMLNKLVVIKLNGGLGTSMGCKGPKSAIPVRNDLTFLDLTVQQIEHLNKTYNVDVPLILMNSFNTAQDTHKIIKKYAGFNVRIITFDQSRYPRIGQETMLPITDDISTESFHEAWYPPGHGDFYRSFDNSGLLDKLINEGKEYCFLSNIDNMGATVDLNILNLCMTKKHEFIMEVTDKTRADIKGGTLIQYEGKLRLLEAAQVPKDHEGEFKSIKKFTVFNTNNLWINLKAIKNTIVNKTLHMEVIVNPKVLERGENVIQLETAVGAAMKCFENGLGINVPRSRFLPVKKCSDLMLIMSNLYALMNGSLRMSNERMFLTTPLIKLGTNFTKVSEFKARFASIPDILELDHLTVSGNVNFGRGVSLRGTVIIVANKGEQIDIPDGAILENKIVSGNLRILEH